MNKQTAKAARQAIPKDERDKEFREWMRAALESFLPNKIMVRESGLDEFMEIIDARIENEIAARAIKREAT